MTRTGHVVLRDHLLRRHVQRDRAQVDPNHLVDDRDQEEQAGPLRRRQQAAEAEDDAALVLPCDPNGGATSKIRTIDDDCDDDERQRSWSSFLVSRSRRRRARSGSQRGAGSSSSADLEHEAFAERLDRDVAYRPGSSSAPPVRTPDLAVHEHEPVGVERLADDADLADSSSLPVRGRALRTASAFATPKPNDDRHERRRSRARPRARSGTWSPAGSEEHAARRRRS